MKTVQSGLREITIKNLIDDKNEYITDRYGRLGHLINLGEYYIFQPIELTDDNISIYDRSVPIPYKRDKLVYSVGEKIDLLTIP